MSAAVAAKTTASFMLPVVVGTVTGDRAMGHSGTFLFLPKGLSTAYGLLTDEGAGSICHAANYQYATLLVLIDLWYSRALAQIGLLFFTAFRRLFCIWLGLARLGLVWFGLVWFGLVRFGSPSVRCKKNWMQRLTGRDWSSEA